MSRIPDFMQSLERMKEIHIRKNEDYASESNPFSNFDVSTYFGSLFSSDRDKAFAILLGTKIGRLSSLLNNDRKPNHESIDDNFIDLANYVLLWKADRIDKIKLVDKNTILASDLVQQLDQLHESVEVDTRSVECVMGDHYLCQHAHACKCACHF